MIYGKYYFSMLDNNKPEIAISSDIFNFAIENI